MERYSLGGNWRFKSVSRPRSREPKKTDIHDWMAATVPGTVHTDLLALKKILDPYYRTNELDVQWVDSEKWVYRKEFAVDEQFLAHERVCLVAEGLDTFAKIRLNDKTIGETADMFVEHRFDVKKALRPGSNVLEIHFDSPTHRSAELERKHGSLQVSHEPTRAYVRKAQYSFGWDWGPKLTTSGIWRPVYLEAFSGCRVKSVFTKTRSIASRRADIRIDVEIERISRGPVELRVIISGNGFKSDKIVALTGNRKSITVKIPDAQLWWPNGYGQQNLYQIDVTASVDGVGCDSKSMNFGIRTVRLLQEKDVEGRSFIIVVNGVKIYCKGADWIPSDNFIPRIPESTYDRLLTLARDAHMNMVRVWGGGIYEQEVFYELCDKYGLMVWQDFMFACSEYPENAWFLRQVRDEAEKAVTRLRNHASIVLWCGNNECEWIFCRENPGKGPDDMSGATIFREILPSVCRKLDGTRPYWRSSPFGAGYPNGESNGNHHEWDVWGLWKDYREYEKVHARFVTEFGFQAPAWPRTMEQVTLPSDRNPQSLVLEHHNKLPEGTERLFRFQASHVPVAQDYEDFVYKGQIVQAEALKTATEHWRRRKFRTAGSMFWQLNDCWPVTSWSVIDSGFRPKAAYYFAKKFYAPVLVSFRRGKNSIEVWVTNDRLSSLNVELHLTLRAFDGKELWSNRKSLTVSANSSRQVSTIGIAEIEAGPDIRRYLHARLIQEGTMISENRFFVAEAKHTHWESLKPVIGVSRNEDGSCDLSIRSETLLRYVRVNVEGEDVIFEDNYFDVDPGVVKTTGIQTSIPLEELRRKLKIHSLGG